jgi:hypothetical protein
MSKLTPDTLVWGKKLTEQESLKIHKQKRKRSVSANLNLYKFIDNDTKQTVIVIPSLEITSYGENEEKATQMLESTLTDTFKFFVDLPKDALEKELSSLGWKHDPLFNKRYSKAFVDGNGDLQGLNAEGGKIERLNLVAA